MSMIFLAKGVCKLGVTKRDKDGNVASSTQAQFTFDDTGSSIAVGKMDPETKEINGETVSIFGDWDAAGYLKTALALLNPRRQVNIPDFKAIIRAAYEEDGSDLVCDYCRSCKCRDCIVREWMEEM